MMMMMVMMMIATMMIAMTTCLMKILWPWGTCEQHHRSSRLVVYRCSGRKQFNDNNPAHLSIFFFCLLTVLVDTNVSVNALYCVCDFCFSPSGLFCIA